MIGSVFPTSLNILVLENQISHDKAFVNTPDAPLAINGVIRPINGRKINGFHLFHPKKSVELCVPTYNSTRGIQSPCQIMIGVYNHLSIVFGFHAPILSFGDPHKFLVTLGPLRHKHLPASCLDKASGCLLLIVVS